MRDNSQEIAVARKLVAAILKADYSITVWDGEDEPVKNCTDIEEIMKNLAQCDEEWIHIENAGVNYGEICLIWGNAEDGSELIADHSDSELVRNFVEEADGP